MTQEPSDERPDVSIACEVLRDILDRLLPDDLRDKVIFQDYGLP